VVINKFRGDPDILSPGIKQIEELTSVPVLGVIPYIEDLSLPEEDSVALQKRGQSRGTLRLCVVRLPRIANFTDFDALSAEREVALRFVTSPEQLHECDAVIIPGTKNTVADLEWLKRRGFAEALLELEGRVPILGICGGYQMLGERVVDEAGVENFEAGEYRGLGLLKMKTRFRGMEKRTVRIEGVAREALTGSEVEVRGYEIHMGESTHEHAPLLSFGSRGEGAFCADRRVMGTYIHGIFDTPGFRRAFISYVASLRGKRAEGKAEDVVSLWERAIERAAGVVERSLDVHRLEEMIFGKG
jgi:adenosylcobyric acid synthase